MNLKYSIEFKLKILDKLKQSNFKTMSEKYKININTLKSWYYKINNQQCNFKNHKQALGAAIYKHINLLSNIKNLYQKEALNTNTFITINKIRKQNQIPLTIILNELNISKSTYYNKLKKVYVMNQKQKQDNDEINLIWKIFNESRKQFGYRKIKAALLTKYHLIMNHKKILRLMRIGKMIIGYFTNKKPKNKHKIGKNRFNVPDLVKRGFKSITQPFKVFYTDVTYHIWNQFRFYQTTIIDAFTKEIIDYQISFKNNGNLIMQNIKKTLQMLKKVGHDIKDTIIHSDHALVYESKAFRAFCNKNQILQSMGQNYSCTDNSVIENFHSQLKKGTIHSDWKKYETIDDYIKDVQDWCIWYNQNKNSNIKLKRNNIIQY